MKIYSYKNGAYVTVTKIEHNGMYSVILKNSQYQILDKMLCDTYRGAMDYKRAFCAIAKSL